MLIKDERVFEIWLGQNQEFRPLMGAASCDSQTKVKFDPKPQVMPYQPSKLVKDLQHTGATFGTSATPVWGEIKIKAPSKVNACISAEGARKCG